MKKLPTPMYFLCFLLFFFFCFVFCCCFVLFCFVFCFFFFRRFKRNPKIVKSLVALQSLVSRSGCLKAFKEYLINRSNVYPLCSGFIREYFIEPTQNCHHCALELTSHTLLDFFSALFYVVTMGKERRKRILTP